MEPVKRPSITRKKSSAMEGVFTRPVSSAVSWVNTTRALQHPGAISKLTFSCQYISVVLRVVLGPATSASLGDWWLPP